MKFTIDEQYEDNLNLIVKENPKKEVVAFYDEIQDASCYSLDIFRTDISFACGYFERLNPECYGRHTSDDRIIYVDDYDHRPKFFYGVIITREINTCSTNSDTNYLIKEISYDNVKYITTIEATRSDCFIKIDFLPSGNYIFILTAYDRNNNVISKTMPYYWRLD